MGYTFKEELYNSNDLNKEYEQAIKTIDNELKKETNNKNNNIIFNNSKIYGDENIDLNIKLSNYINKTINNTNNTNTIIIRIYPKSLSKKFPYRRKG